MDEVLTPRSGRSWRESMAEAKSDSASHGRARTGRYKRSKEPKMESRATVKSEIRDLSGSIALSGGLASIRFRPDIDILFISWQVLNRKNFLFLATHLST